MRVEYEYALLSIATKVGGTLEADQRMGQLSGPRFILIYPSHALSYSKRSSNDEFVTIDMVHLAAYTRVCHGSNNVANS